MSLRARPSLTPVALVALVAALLVVVGCSSPRQTAAPSPNAFGFVGMATHIDATWKSPDPRAITDSYPANTANVYIVFELRPGFTGTVQGQLYKKDGTPLMAQPLELNYTTQNRFGSFRISTGGGLPPGKYTARVTLKGFSDTQEVEFRLIDVPTGSGSPAGSASP